MNSDNKIGLPYLHDFFYTEIPSNKDELLNGIENGELDDEQGFEWNEEEKECPALELERLKIKDNMKLFIPSINNYLEQLQVTDQILDVQLNGLWRNTYHKYSCQEIHDHGFHHISGVLFLTDEQPGDSQFYFFNKSYSEIPNTLRQLRKGDSIIFGGRYWIKAQRGRIVLFPSYLMHGVTPHKTDNPRRTASFNFDIILKP